MLTIAGYGSGKYCAASGPCTQYVAPGLTFPFEMVELAAAARQGDSGGPIFNTRGELAGVLFGAGEGRTSGSYCGRVQWFLDSILGGSGNGPRGVSPGNGGFGAGSMIAQSNGGAPGGSAVGSAVGGHAGAAQIAAAPAFGSNAATMDRPGHTTWADADSPGPMRALPPRSTTKNQAIADGRPRDMLPSTAAPGTLGDAAAPRDVAALASGDPSATDARSETPATGESDLAAGEMGRWEQIKAFLGVVGGLGVLLMVVRSLAGGSEPPAEAE